MPHLNIVKTNGGQNDVEGYIAIDHDRPGCSAWGETKSEAIIELVDARKAWDEAKRKAPLTRRAHNEQQGKTMARNPGPRENPDRKCYGPYCDNILRRYPGKSRYWRHIDPSFGYKGNDYFCSLQCATNWAVAKCSAGSDD